MAARCHASERSLYCLPAAVGNQNNRNARSAFAPADGPVALAFVGDLKRWRHLRDGAVVVSGRQRCGKGCRPDLMRCSRVCKRGATSRLSPKRHAKTDNWLPRHRLDATSHFSFSAITRVRRTILLSEHRNTLLIHVARQRRADALSRTSTHCHCDLFAMRTALAMSVNVMFFAGSALNAAPSTTARCSMPRTVPSARHVCGRSSRVIGIVPA